MGEVIKIKLKHVFDNLKIKNVKPNVTKPTALVNDLKIVGKKNCSIRICLNPTALNKYIRREHQNTETTKELRNKLSCKILHTVHMKDGFHKIEMGEESSVQCTFATSLCCHKLTDCRFVYLPAQRYFKRRTNISLAIYRDFNMILMYL